MCDSCGCRDQRLLDVLGAEHDAIAGLVHRCRGALAAGDLDTARGLGTQIANEFFPHAAVEEAGLFPALAEAGFGAEVDDLVSEHRAMDALPGVLHDPSLAGLPRLLDVLAAHAYREEQDVFPAARTVLDAAGWARANAAVS